MGLFKDAFRQARYGADRTLHCQECGDAYLGSISREFPDALCGKHLERLGERAKRNGDNRTYQLVQMEFRRRGC